MDAPSLTRGGFIRLTGALGAGLGIAVYLPACGRTSTAQRAFAPNAYVRIAPDNTVTLIVCRSEMGQGIITGITTVLADELDASPDRVKYEFAPVDPVYNEPPAGEMLTGGSWSLRDQWMPLREAGATARAMLVAAAAKQWSVDPSSCTANNGVVYHAASNRSATYGSLAAAAADIPVPANVPLKSPDRFTLIGKQRQRVDLPQKVNGSAQYGIDVRVPGMLYAAVVRSPVFGGRVKTFDASRAKATPGVLYVVQISNGVAVVAKNTWAAFQGRKAVDVVWDEGPNANLSTASLFADAERLAKTHSGERVALVRGNPDTNSGTVIEATYRGPFLAHNTMEPQNATADVRDDRCDVWVPTQVQTRSQTLASKASGLPPEKCMVHTTFLGGGFGRRLEADYVTEAVEVSKAIKAPVKVMWSREDDIQHDFYRPMSVNVVRGVVSDGQLVALSHLVVQRSLARRFAPALFQHGIDVFFSMAEVLDAPYHVANFRVSYIDHEHPIPIGNWRAPHANWNAFVTESFIDELAHTAGKDPLSFRLSLLKGEPRATRVLQLATEKAGWGTQNGSGTAQGLAVITWAGSYAATVADVSIKDGKPKVHRVVTAVDCGTIVNPDVIIQQGQSATNFGLSAAQAEKITFEHGRVQQNNFYDYTVLHLADAPAIEVHMVQSNEKPTGVGELCTPGIAPAVANALFALTGKRIRQLPFSDVVLT